MNLHKDINMGDTQEKTEIFVLPAHARQYGVDHKNKFVLSSIISFFMDGSKYNNWKNKEATTYMTWY